VEGCLLSFLKQKQTNKQNKTITITTTTTITKQDLRSQLWCSRCANATASCLLNVSCVRRMISYACAWRCWRWGRRTLGLCGALRNVCWCVTGSCVYLLLNPNHPAQHNSWLQGASTTHRRQSRGQNSL
jgi:hypothetical protein